MHSYICNLLHYIRCNKTPSFSTVGGNASTRCQCVHVCTYVKIANQNKPRDVNAVNLASPFPPRAPTRVEQTLVQTALAVGRSRSSS